MMLGVAFIRNSDVRYDTRLRKAMYESMACGLPSHFFGWIRDGGDRPSKHQLINKEEINTTYFLLQAKFGNGFKNIFKLIAFNLWLFKNLVLQRRSYNSIYVCDLDVAVPAIIMKLIFRKKIIYDIFDFYSHTHSIQKNLKILVEKVEYSVCRLSDFVIVCTEKRASELKDKTGIDPIVIFNTPNLSNKPSDYEKDKTVNKMFSIVYVGTLPATSRLLVEITEKIKINPEIEFHVAGTGPLEDYFNAAARLNANIFFYGQITNLDALNLQNSADILFATYDPSLEINRKSAPNKVYEAMALSKPIIVCCNTDADSVITENQCGHSITYDAVEFMYVVNKYKKNNYLKRLHGSNGFKLYQKNYSWSICRDKLHQIFKLL